MSFRQLSRILQAFSQKFNYRSIRTPSKNIENLKKFKHSNNYIKYIFGPFGTLSAFFIGQNSSSTTPQSTSLTKFKNKMADEHSNLESIIENADQLFDENHFQECYDTLSKYNDQSLPEIIWREARAIFQLSKTVKDKNGREKLIRQSYDLIKLALDKDDKNYAIHKWMAIILDAYAELNGIKARITELNTVSDHMKKAIDLNPNDPTSWYLLGAFQFGLADLPWVQRKIVSTIFASPPTGTYEQALEYFKKAEEIKEGFYTMNWLMLGKCYYSLKDYVNAKKYFEKAANCTVLNEDDKSCKEEAQKWLKKV